MVNFHSFRIFISFLLFPIAAFAQPEPLKVSELASSKAIGSHCRIILTKENFPQPDHYFSNDFRLLDEKAYQGKGFQFYNKTIDGGYWIYLEAVNFTTDTITAYFFFGRYFNSRLYMYETNTGLKHEIDLRSLFLKNKDFIFPVTFRPNSGYRLCIYLNETNSALSKPVFLIAGKDKASVPNLLSSNRNYSKMERIFDTYASLLLQGFLLCMLAFSLVYFFISWQKVFICYFFYILIIFVYFFHRYFEIEATGLFWHRVAFLKDLTWQPLSYLLYYLFAIHFVDYKKLDTRLLKLIKWMIGLLTAYLIVDFMLHLLHEYNLRSRLYYYFRYVTGIPALVCIFWSWSLNDKLAKILATGSMFMVGGALVTMLIAFNFRNTGNLWLDHHMIYMFFGTAVETMFFAMGLSYKNMLADKAKNEIEKELSIEKEKQEALRLRTIIETQEHERERVSLELHDDLGSGLTSIRMLSQMAQQEKESKLYFEKINRIAGEVIDNMRQIIWSMDPANSNLTELIRRVKVYSDEFLATANLRLIFRKNTELPALKLKREQVRNLFLVVKECLHNIVKHAGAQCITITISMQNQVLIITIHDDGKGISVVNDERMHHGMNSMKKRMKQIQGDIYFTSDNGTTAHIEVNL